SGVDGVEPALGVDVDDPLTDVETVVVLLVLFVLVERLAIAEGPLPLAARALVVAVRRPGRGRHGASFASAGAVAGARLRRPPASPLSAGVAHKERRLIGHAALGR